MFNRVGFRSAVIGVAVAALATSAFADGARAASALAAGPAVERSAGVGDLPILRASSKTAFGKDWHGDPHDRRGPHDESGDWRYGDGDRDGGYDYGRDDGYDYNGDGDYDDDGRDHRRHGDRDRDRDRDDSCWSRECDDDHPRDHGRHEEEDDSVGLDQGGLMAVLIGGAIAAVLLGGVLDSD